MKLSILLIFSSLLLLFGCSASTGSRYEKSKEETQKTEEVKVDETAVVEETIDITPYRETFEITETPAEPILAENLDLWFNYDSQSMDEENNREIVDQADGYRVQVIVTDDLEEANQIRSEIYFKTNQKSVYIIFEPPFYKVKTGDFINISDARDLNFKLNQMGYKESKVVTEKVNVFK